jgi:DNA-binding transcriptional MerR regulator
MSGRVTIGEFSTMTRLSRKALRHYHDLGLLEPAEVDPINGYRYYDVAQVEVARIIRRFRDLDMPVPDLKSYVTASDDGARDAIVSAHLDRMQAQLGRTEEAVSALRALLRPAGSIVPITVRTEAAVTAAAITETVSLDGLVRWWEAAMRELGEALRRANVIAGGPPSASFAQAMFSEELGEATVWLPLTSTVPNWRRVRTQEIAGGRFAVAVHDGPDARIDETYARLGTYVAERAIGIDAPVRERYLAGALNDPRPLITEIAWPIAEPAG